MTDLQVVAKQYEADGWTITSMTDLQFTAGKRPPASAAKIIVGVIGLFFFVVPGLIVLFSAFNQKEIMVLVTADEATEILRKSEEAANTGQPVLTGPELGGAKKVEAAKQTNKMVVRLFVGGGLLLIVLLCGTVMWIAFSTFLMGLGN